MNPGRITAWSAGAVLALGLAACGGSTSGGTAAPASSGAAPQSAAAAATTPAGVGRLVRGGRDQRTDQRADPAGDAPGARPAARRSAGSRRAAARGRTPGSSFRSTWCPSSRRSMSDFKNVDLTGAQKSDTPYYVKLQIKALGAAPPKSDDDPAIAFDRD